MPRRSLSTRVSALLAVVAMLIVPSTSFAQTATGQITGTVRDTTGAVMSGVKVVVTNQQTGLTRQTQTGTNGDYVIPLLPVGVYVVTGEQTGFKTAIHSDLALTVDQIQRIDLVLAAGDVTETVDVHRERTGPRYRQRLDRPHHHGEAGHRSAAQRSQLPAAAVPRRRRGGDGRRAGRHATGRGQRDQHHGRPADVEQLHDRRHRQHRHLDRDAGRGPVGGCDPGVQGTDHDLLGRVRVQLQPDQPGEQDRHERAARDRSSGSSGTTPGTPETSSTTRRCPRRSWIRSSSGSSSAGR